MHQELALFVTTFSTLLAIVNPLETLPIFLTLMRGEADEAYRRVAWSSCLYAMLLLFFLVFGTLILRVFGVPLSMVRIVGGIVLARIGFDLFSGSASSSSAIAPAGGAGKGNVAFVPLAMPIMCGPGAIATTLGMTSLIKQSQFEVGSFLAIFGAMAATMLVTYFCLANAERLVGRIGPMGIDAVTRIVGFFISAMGMGLIFRGIIEACQGYGLIGAGKYLS